MCGPILVSSKELMQLPKNMKKKLLKLCCLILVWIECQIAIFNNNIINGKLLRNNLIFSVL